MKIWKTEDGAIFQITDEDFRLRCAQVHKRWKSEKRVRSFLEASGIILICLGIGTLAAWLGIQAL